MSVWMSVSRKGFYNLEMTLERNELIVGMPVAALYSDGVWYRGMIASNVDQRGVNSVAGNFEILFL